MCWRRRCLDGGAPLAKEYRSRTRILLDILRALRDEKRTGITRLLFLANLSHDRLTGYLRELIDRAWVAEVEVESRRAWELTPAGRAVVLDLEKINRFMDDFGLEL